MRLQTKPNPWSCIGSAFAMVLDIPTADFFGLVGHDGSAIAFPMLPDPMARRGLHIQECTAACLRLGYAVTPVELFPVIRPTSTNGCEPCENLVVLLGDDEAANWQRFNDTIRTSTGVLEGVGHRCLHAVAYDHGTIFDPDGDGYRYSRRACESRGFRPRRAWRVDPLLSSELLRKGHAMSSYDHGLTNKITKSLDRERNEQLFHRIMAGDQQAREEMIEGNMPLVIVKVNSFIQRNPQLAHLRDDLHSAGFVGLVQAVNKMAEAKGSAIINPTDYVSAAITNELTALRAKEADTGFSKISAADRKEANLPTVIHSVPESMEDPKQAATQGALELRDMLESCCESDEERTLIRMREEGYSDREIAEALDMSRTSIHTLRKELEKRFNQKCRELEED